MPSNQNTEHRPGSVPAVLALGFRPFFLFAGIYGLLGVLLWSMAYGGLISLPLDALSASQWHGHEMIYGYSTAVIAGFLLTAVYNWTGQITPTGTPLAFLLLLWLSARLALPLGLISLAAVFDLLFLVLLNLVLLLPIVKTRNWRQLAVITKLMFLAAGNVLFYLSVMGYLPVGMRLALDGGLYLIIGLILMIGRRVVPGFIDRGLALETPRFNSRWLDISSLILFLVFFVAELAAPGSQLSGMSAALLAVINGIRLVGWYHPQIWSRPLLWSLYLALWWIVAGFLLLATSIWMETPRFLALHAMAFGGIGLMTLSMMSRVSLGHTGRNIHDVPRGMTTAYRAIVAGTLLRVVGPMLAPEYYLWWVEAAQLMWATAFAIFCFSYYPVLTKPRVDGRPG